MGMFNNLTIDESITLPDLPSEIDRKTLVFQTKDLDENLMLNFRVNSEKKLEILRQTGHHFENPNIPFFGMEFVVEKEWWEPYDFTGTVGIYESYNHPEDKGTNYGTPDAHRFISGWIEWNVKLFNGEMVDIVSTVGTPPHKRTDEELKAYLEEAEQSRKEMNDRLRKNRLESPNAEQKLIDEIDEITRRNYVIPEIEDYYTDLKEIQNKINEYRTKHDRWYGTAPEQD
jgi:hypothetical protein